MGSHLKTIENLKFFGHVPLEFNIPKKVWAGKDISYFHLKVYRCKASA